MRAVGGLCLEVLIGTWEPDPFLGDFFLIGNDLLYRKKNNTEQDQDPTSQARPRDTDHLRPSNLVARTLYLVEHTPSKFGHDPPLRRGLVAAIKCCVRKKKIAAVEQNEKPEPCVGFNTTGENLFRFLFSGTIIVSLRT